ncbi:MAG: ParA family protein [Dissulfurispiraceae bacterium]
MAVKIVVANKKGGVGKTTTAVNVAGFLADMGHKVLAIDADSNASLTVSFGISPSNGGNGLAEVLEGKCSINDAVTEAHNIHVVKSKDSLGKIFVSGPAASHLKKNELLRFRMEDVDSRYDYIILDTAPDFGPLTYNCLAVADYVLIPVQYEHLAVHGLRQMIDEISDLREQFFNPNIKILGIVGTFYQGNNNCKSHLSMIRERSSDDVFYVFQTYVRKNVRLSECSRDGVPMAFYDLKCHGYEDYKALTAELVGRVWSLKCQK